MSTAMQRMLKRRPFYYRAWRYGLTDVEIEAMVKRVMEEGCPICGKKPTKSHAVSIDHDHETSRVRGALCNLCNSRLGWYEQHATKIAAHIGEIQ